MEKTDEVIATLAEAQHGVVARRQLLDLGIGPRAIGCRIDRGSFRLLHHGVYAVGHRAIGAKGMWMAAVLACGPGAVLSHRAAGSCWGLIRYSGLPEVMRPGQFRKREGIVARFGAVPADERGLQFGIAITSVPRTVLDMAGVIDRARLQRVLHEVDTRQLSDPLSLPEIVRRHPRHPGAPALGEIVAEMDVGVPANEFEDAFAALLDRHGLPLPRFNPDLHVRGRFVRPDCIWDEQGLIVELDGRAVHGTRVKFEKDRERDRLLVAAGFRVIRITWRQLRDAPDEVLTDVRDALVALEPTSSPK